MVGVLVPSVQILQGGLGPGPAVTAKVVLASRKTNGQGQIKGTFRSGNRTGVTRIGIKGRGSASNKVLAFADIAQVWSLLQTWESAADFDYGKPTPTTFKMAYTRAGMSTPIDAHSLDIKCDRISGYRWDPAAGIDEDGDGNVDGDYVPDSFARGTASFEATVSSTDPTRRRDLVVVSPNRVTSRDGKYRWKTLIRWNGAFVVDATSSGVVDRDAFGIAGDNGQVIQQ